MELFSLLQELDVETSQELSTAVDIIDCETFPATFYSEARKWKRIRDVVVVVADLTNSTKLNFDKYVNTSASIYEAAVGGAVTVLSEFSPDFVDIQGDGLFALFHGDKSVERGLCAAVTIKTFSERVLVPQMQRKLSAKTPTTGFKVGMDIGLLAVKRVGVRGTNDPIWAGKPVNWAFKCAQSAEAHQLVVTDRFFKKVSSNDFVRYSCGCGSLTGPSDLWKRHTVAKLPDDQQACHRLETLWCVACGEDFCNAILEGKTTRQDAPRRVA